MIFKTKNKVIVYTIPSLEEVYILFGQKSEHKISDIYQNMNLEGKKNELKECIKSRIKPSYVETVK